MTDNERCLLFIPNEANYIEILGYKIDGYDSFEAFCEHLNKYAELEETVNRQKAEIERLREPTSASAIFELSKQQERAVEEHSKYVAKIKAEAVKDFALELKRIPRISVYKNEIDNLLREKVGDK